MSQHTTLSTQPTAEAALRPAPATPQAAGDKLDLSKMAPPEHLEEVRLEEFTIDGICGVY